jgi:hypothetical protein
VAWQAAQYRRVPIADSAAQFAGSAGIVVWAEITAQAADERSGKLLTGRAFSGIFSWKCPPILVFTKIKLLHLLEQMGEIAAHGESFRARQQFKIGLVA